MAIITSYQGSILVNAIDLSDHLKKLTVDDGQESREATAMGNTYRVFRAGLGTPSISATFHNDQASGSVAATLRGLVSIASTGFNVIARATTAAISTGNALYTQVSILDGSALVIDDSPGEISEITAKFLPYSTFTISTTAT